MENKTRIYISITLISAMFAVALFSGCVRHYKKSGGLVPQYHPIAEKEYTVVGKSLAESSSFRLFWLIPVTKPLDFNETVEQAVNSKGGDNLVSIRWWYERQYWFVGTVDILYVEGDVIRYEDE